MGSKWRRPSSLTIVGSHITGCATQPSAAEKWLISFALECGAYTRGPAEDRQFFMDIIPHYMQLFSSGHLHETSPDESIEKRLSENFDWQAFLNDYTQALMKMSSLRKRRRCVHCGRGVYCLRPIRFANTALDLCCVCAFSIYAFRDGQVHCPHPRKVRLPNIVRNTCSACGKMAGCVKLMGAGSVMYNVCCACAKYDPFFWKKKNTPKTCSHIK